MTPLPHVHPALHIGSDDDASRVLVNRRTPGMRWILSPLPGWAIVHAAKSPWHAEMVGYHSGAAPAESPERWVARRERRMALNIIDAAPTPPHVPTLVSILDTATVYISEYLDQGLSVLVQCNMGLSRSPAVVLWWMHRTDPEEQFEAAMLDLSSDHPSVKQDSGIVQFVRDNWS